MDSNSTRMFHSCSRILSCERSSSVRPSDPSPLTIERSSFCARFFSQCVVVSFVFIELKSSRQTTAWRESPQVDLGRSEAVIEPRSPNLNRSYDALDGYVIEGRLTVRNPFALRAGPSSNTKSDKPHGHKPIRLGNFG